MSDTAARADTTPSNRDVFNVAWPLTFKAMMVNAIVLIDAYLVSGLGEPALAAMGLAAAFGSLLVGTLMAFSTATQIRLAQAAGSGRRVALKTGFYAGLVTNLAVGASGVALVALFGGGMLERMAHTPWIAEQAKSYLYIFLMVVMFEAVAQNIGSFFNGSGRTIIPLKSFLIAIPINVTTSYLLIHGAFGLPALGVAGAAIGSVLGAATRSLYMGVSFYRETGGYLDEPGWLHGTLRRSLARHLSFSMPIAGTFVSNAVANYAATLLFAKMSVNQFAAMTLILPWVQAAGTFGIAWAQSTGIIVAQLLGNDRGSEELDAFLGRAWRMAFVAAGLVSLAYLVICLASTRIYAGLEAETTAALLSFLPVLLVLPFPKGSNAICGQTLRAGGDTLYVMNIFVAAQWLVRIPLTALFVLHLDLSVTWVFALFLVEELVKFPLFHMRLYKGEWKRGLAVE
ncbi:MATE family efflux transporter [uncultured Limimaricola sp.]|uniref:MATE family efflux transporter n=1 Tax=uncultured Limimaricola sp. TaxID=2211667 RepID=UPI0030F97376